MSTTHVTHAAAVAHVVTDSGSTTAVPALDVNLSTRAADATLSGMSAKLPASLGVKAGAESISVALSTEDAAKVPSLGQALAAASSPVVLPLSQLPNASTATPSTTASQTEQPKTTSTPSRSIQATLATMPKSFSPNTRRILIRSSSPPVKA